MHHLQPSAKGIAFLRAAGVQRLVVSDSQSVSSPGVQNGVLLSSVLMDSMYLERASDEKLNLG